ncbi:MAG: hypothetical protein ACTHU0_21745 [Kofleriaceae bacterium]
MPSNIDPQTSATMAGGVAGVVRGLSPEQIHTLVLRAPDHVVAQLGANFLHTPAEGEAGAAAPVTTTRGAGRRTIKRMARAGARGARVAGRAGGRTGGAIKGRAAGGRAQRGAQQKITINEGDGKLFWDALNAGGATISELQKKLGWGRSRVYDTAAALKDVQKAKMGRATVYGRTKEAVQKRIGEGNTKPARRARKTAVAQA